jgi:RNA polymerase sigma-70 factor (ECF subfamily)
MSRFSVGAATAPACDPWTARLLAARDGPAADRERLFRELRPWWLALAWRLVRDRELAEEATQNASLSLLCNLHRFDPERCRRAKSWLARVLVNCAIDQIRRRRRALPPLDFDPPARSGGGPDELAQRRDQAEHLRRLLGGLPPRHREVLILRFEQELTYKQIGERMGVGLLAAYRLVNRALDELAGRAGAAGAGRAA